MRSRSAAARRVLHIVLLAALLTGAGYWHWGLFPGSLKSVPVDAIRSATGLEADFSRILYLPFHGIRIEAPSLKDKNGFELFKARSIRLATDLPAFLREDRIVIRKIDVDSPITEFRLASPDDPPSAAEPPSPPTAEADAATGAGSAPGAPDEAPVPEEHLAAHHPFVVLEAIFDDSFLPSNVYLNELEVRHGKIVILPADKDDTVPIETLREIRFRTELDKRPLIPVQAMFRTSFGRGDFKAEGIVDLSDGKHRLALSGNIDRLPSWALPWTDAHDVRIEHLRGDVRLALLFDGESLLTFRLDSDKTALRAAWEERGAQGTFGLKTAGSYDFGTRRLDAATGRIEATAAQFTGLSEHVGEVRVASGLFTWDPDRFEFPRVLGSWQNAPFSIEGGIGRAEGLPARFTFRQNLTTLEPYRPVLPAFFDHPIDPGSFSGKLAVQAELEGPAAELFRHIRSVRIDVREGSLSPKFLNAPLTEIAGPLLVEPMGVYSAQDLFFRKNGDPYTLSGQYNSAPGGAGKFTLTAPKWEVNARFKAWPDRVQFSTLTAQSGASHAGAAGTLWLGDDPSINTDFRAHLVSEELAKDWAASLPWLGTLKLKGVIDADGSARGAVKRLTGLTATVKARSDRLTYADHYVLEPIEADLRLDSGLLEVVYAKAGFYGGEARATGRADLTELSRPYFETQVFTQDTDLAKLTKDLEFVKNKLSGRLNLDLTLSGLMNQVGTLKGHGNFRIDQGEIWQTELFKRLKKVLFLTIEGADNVVFDRANGTFTIADGKLHTEDCTLSSKLIDVHFSGSIGFNASVALNVVSRFTSGIFKEASEVGGFTPALINMAQDKITRYLVTGTLKDPVFTAQN